jgi:hypothetical protein
MTLCVCQSADGSWRVGLGIADWRTPPLRKLAKASRLRNTLKLSVYGSVCVNQLMEAGGWDWG